MQDEIERLREVLQAHVALMQRFRENPSNHTTQTTNINAGGWGVLLALVMVAFLAGLNLTQSANNAKLAAEVNDIRRRNDLANDKLSVILQWAPELAKKVDQSTNNSTTGKGEH